MRPSARNGRERTGAVAEVVLINLLGDRVVADDDLLALGVLGNLQEAKCIPETRQSLFNGSQASEAETGQRRERTVTRCSSYSFWISSGVLLLGARRSELEPKDRAAAREEEAEREVEGLAAADRATERARVRANMIASFAVLGCR